jgi:DnaK suppressor protein
MNRASLPSFDARLAQNEAALMRVLKDHLHANGQHSLFDQLNQYHATGDDRVADLASETALALHHHELQSLADVQAARRRITAGSYGTCTQCGEEISEARLMAYPTAKRCIDCQRRHEAAHATTHASL